MHHALQSALRKRNHHHALHRAPVAHASGENGHHVVRAASLNVLVQAHAGLRPAAQVRGHGHEPDEHRLAAVRRVQHAVGLVVATREGLLVHHELAVEVRGHLGRLPLHIRLAHVVRARSHVLHARHGVRLDHHLPHQGFQVLLLCRGLVARGAVRAEGLLRRCREGSIHARAVLGVGLQLAHLVQHLLGLPQGQRERIARA
mmetsp:Transcript_8789/g.30002  ORF Transcript_8789/g.30002 Transcript_8789/m.30002 type:complete len:202 (-) Transcript_8789:838-1443(-)